MTLWAEKQKGFTIVELLIVVVIIAILATLTVLSYNGIVTRASDSTVKTAAQQASQEIQTYMVTASTANPFPSAPAAFQACKGIGVSCDYVRSDYTEVESGERVYAYSLTVCDAKGSVQYIVTNFQSTPQKLTNPASLVPQIDNQYGLFTSGSMSVSSGGPPGTEVGQIFANTGQIVTMTVVLKKCSQNGVSYQWQSRPNISASWTNISGATSATYTTPTLNSSYDGRQYRVSVTNQYGTTSSKYGGMIMDFEP